MKTILIIVLLFSFNISSADRNSEYSLTNHSFGPIEIGMQKQQVSALLNNTLIDKTDSKSEDSCHIAISKNNELEFMFENGKLTVIKTQSANIKTINNITIGSSKEAVENAFRGKLSIDYHEDHYGLLAHLNKNNKEYKPKEEYITYYVSYGVNNPILKIESYNGSITSIAAGILPSIDYKEGCL